MTDPDAPLDDEPGRHAADERPPGLLERWQATEPVRVALYPVAVALVALLVGYDLVTPERAPLWLAVVAAVAGGGLPILGAEVARRQAWSPATVRRTVDEWREHEYGEGWNDGAEITRREFTTPTAEPLPATVESPEARPEPLEPEHPATAEIPRLSRGVPPSTP